LKWLVLAWWKWIHKPHTRGEAFDWICATVCISFARVISDEGLGDEWSQIEAKPETGLIIWRADWKWKLGRTFSLLTLI
jgi:hypothetical protein